MGKRTKADFKREIKRGMTLKVVAHGLKPETIGKERVITEVRSNSIITDGSFYTEIPRANLLEYTGDSFTIYQAGRRGVTEQEKKVLQGLTQGKVSKREIRESKLGYLVERKAGKELKKYQGMYYIEDENIKGPILVKYDIIGEGNLVRSFKEYYQPKERENYGRSGYRIGAIIEEMIKQGDIEGIVIEGTNISVDLIRVKRLSHGGRQLEIVGYGVLNLPSDGDIMVIEGQTKGQETLYILGDAPRGSTTRSRKEIKFKYKKQ